MLAGCAQMSEPASASSNMAMSMSDAEMSTMLASWPEASRMAAMSMMDKYGPPNHANATMLTWLDNGPWKWTRVFSKEVQHNFPTPHPDVLEQAIDYRAPVDKYDDLAQFDGSVMLERTKGIMSARCDKEGANFLALNLANDVATGRRSVEEARDYYARAMQTFKQTQQMDPYMQGLTFQVPRGNTGDPDRAIF